MGDAVKDLRTYLNLIQNQAPELWLEVERELNLDCEMTALVKKLGSQKRYPVVYFELVSGIEHPVVCNLFANRKAIAFALGCPPEEMNETYLARINNPIPPEVVNDGSVKEVLQRGNVVDLTSLHVPKHHEEDAGPYISAEVCIVKNADRKSVGHVPLISFRNFLKVNRLRIKSELL